MFDNSIVTITGGTGSFGTALVKHLLKTNIHQIRLFSRDEKKQEDMRISFSTDRLKFYIGDVRDIDSLTPCLKGTDYVFHAAALKQVPSCEFYPIEAVKTNIIGTQNILQASSQSGVKKVVLLSTDKAVYPINAMGMSKALAEKVLIAKARSQLKNETIFCATRYGNVMCSRGSVIPLFISQIRNKQSITITDPNMTRFLMSLDESVKLVFYAFNHGNQGDIFIQKSPACTVGDLALALKEIFNSQSDIRVIGTRHGEKLYETLISREEMLYANEMENFFRIQADTRDLNYAKYFSEGQESISNISDYTSHNTYRLSIDEIKAKLQDLDLKNQRID